MCGIFGARGPLANDPEALRRAAGVQRHRGPDGFGEFLDDARTTYLAHNRLSIIDLTVASSQPFSTAEGVLAFNGEIYNYVELREELACEGAVFTTTGDTEVLATLLARWGVEGLARVRGMFAFAYFDRKSRSLVLVRDRFGIKPLFVAAHAGSVLFASEIETLRATGQFSETDDEARAIYHLLGYLPAPFSFYKGIVRVPPGHLVRVAEDGTYSMERWYRLEARVHGDLTELLRRSVAEHMRCDVDYGVFLSGGLDSNIVAALATEQSPGRIKTFSIGFRSFPAFDETKGAMMAARYLGSEHHQFDIDERELGAAAEDCLVKLARGEPFADPSFIPTWLVSNRARTGSKVSLSGDGADEIFGGYRKHRGIRPAAWMRNAPPGIRESMKRLAVRLPEARDNRLLELSRRFKKFVQGAGQEQNLRQLAWLYAFFPADVDRFMPGRGRAAEARLLGELAKVPALAGARDEVNDVLYADTCVFLAADMLHKVDLASMDHGLEVRVPFLDHEVVETAFALPGKAKVGLVKGKLELRRRFGSRIAPKLLKLPKRGFESPLSALFRGSFRGRLSRESESWTALGIERSYIAELEREHESSAADHSWRMWNLLVLARWSNPR
ncbi:MAG TPA: asparagine synthase (glutamine-hydrolyzing) [Polyangiaceae bacterium]|jgi:asparagine synthase (glutamine-hydrolysing)|nr:asparagine synthase (glutamine-hydrolyzing) [Polyangiaceae bacterium]